MSGFDVKKWKKRRVHQKTIDDTKTVVDWCTRRGLVVDYVRTDIGGEYKEHENKIVICNNLAPHKQLYFLLHECGHYLIIKSRKKKRHMSPEEWSDMSNTWKKIDIIREEIVAWDRAENLAIRLGLVLDERYQHVRVNALMTYVKAMADPNRRAESV